MLGGGSWGITLSILLFRNQIPVRLWTRNPEKARRLREKREDPDRLPGVYIPKRIRIYTDLEKALEGARWVLLAIPSQALREVMRQVVQHTHPSKCISASKGIEVATGLRMEEVVLEETGGGIQYAVLSGPSIAREVIQEVPTSVVVAARDEAYAREVQKLFHQAHFRVYTHTDVTGVELGGALKNIYAIAAGMVDGLNLGINAKSALLTRALVEMARFGEALGAQRQTFYGLSGIGDLIVTAFSRHSRNRYVGEALGEGADLQRILRGMTMVAEGVETARAVIQVARKRGIEMPIAEVVHDVLQGRISAREGLDRLVHRPPKSEEEPG